MVLDYAKQHDSPCIHPCRKNCGEIYCSADCEHDFWHNGGHSLLCTGDIKVDDHPLLDFKRHAMQHNEILLLVADVMARILSNPSSVPAFTDFTMVPWWDVACAPLLQGYGGFADAAVLEKSIRTVCDESASKLRLALGLPDDHPYVNALMFAKVIGSFEQNSMGIRNRHPLCRAIFDADLRRSFKKDVILCLSRAGMIGGDCEDEDCEDDDDNDDDNNAGHGDTEKTGEDKMEEDENEEEQMEDEQAEDHCEEEMQAEIDPTPGFFQPVWDYTDEEIAVFLACLDMEEFNPDGDDLDELFNPLDGTAMFSTACKMNHSCDPNVVLLYRTRHWGEPLVGHVVAIRDIAPGEELCISYIDVWETLETRTEQLANYGFLCHCNKCTRERNGECLEKEEEEKMEEDALFGKEDDDDDEEESPTEPRDGERLLQRLGELNEKLNENHLGCTPMKLFGEASSFVIRVGALSIDGLETKGDNVSAMALQACIDAVADRNLIGSQKLGTALATELFGMLQEQGSWSHPAYRQALVASSMAAAIGFCHVGSFLEAQRLLDRAMVLGLPRDEVSGFVEFVEHFANHMTRGPIEPALEGHVLYYNSKELNEVIERQGLSTPIAFPIPESSCDIDANVFQIECVDTEICTVFRGFARDWKATQKWRNLHQLVQEHGHRIIPVELGSMMKESGMKETLMSLRHFVGRFLIPSSAKKCWSLADAQEQAHSIAYLAQHSLLSQVSALGEDVERSPRLCGVQGPSQINVWMGTGGTRSPLHFDSYDNLLVQVVGAKYVRLYSCDQTDKLYVIKGNGGVASQGNMGAVNCELEDWLAHPEAKSAKYQEVLLLPGDCLFIAARTWHYVRSLSTSISVNYWW
jgi:hypothetical protein